MRAFVMSALAAAGLAASLPLAASAAELEPQAEGCRPGTVWDGYRCVRPAPRAYYAPPAETVVVERPVVVPAPVYAAPVYATPYYVAPAVGVGVVVGPRYWGPGWGYYGWGSGRTVVRRTTVVHRHAAVHRFAGRR